MIEIPAAALVAATFMRRLDFLSIGTNDLIQYTLAIDRTDDAVAHLYDPLHPAVLQLVAHVIRGANKAGVPVAVCGEMAGDDAAHAPAARLRPAPVLDASGAPADGQAAGAQVRSDAESHTLANRMLKTDDPDKLQQLLERMNA